MTDSAKPPADYDHRTTNHAVIREWISHHEGTPVAIQDAVDHELAVEFDEVDDAVETPLDWTAFFDRFEEENLVFAFQSPPAAAADACTFFDRTRVEASNRLGDDDETRPDYLRLDVERASEDVGDGESTVRNAAAREQENPDNHRDDPPFMS
jgi:hypothetical protein